MFHRQAAVKLILPPAGSAGIIARFQQEREILGALPVRDDPLEQGRAVLDARAIDLGDDLGRVGVVPGEVAHSELDAHLTGVALGLAEDQAEDAVELGLAVARVRFQVGDLRQAAVPPAVEEAHHELGVALEVPVEAAARDAEGVEKPHRALPVRVQRSSGSDQDARVEKCPNHQALRSFRPDDSLSRARAPGG